MEDAQVHVLTATAPELVMPLVQTTAPGAIVLDMNLPEQSGWSIFAALRKHPRFRSLPVLMLTATHEEASRVAAQHDPWVAVFLTPFDLDAIVQSFQRLAHQQVPGMRTAQRREVAPDQATSLPRVSGLLLSGDSGK
jgi:two-component system chemotaxis response regulator CheY